MRKARRDFDLPVINLVEGENYIPPKARDEEEIARRRTLPRGTLILEQQAKGLQVAAGIYSYPAEHRSDQDYIDRRIASALMNSAWYTFGNDTPDIIMRRRLKLPILADDKEDLWKTREQLFQDVRVGLGHTAALGLELALAHRNRLDTKRLNNNLGRAMGNTALMINSLQHTDTPLGMSETDVQNVVMLSSADLLESSRISHQEFGFHASVAQLANPNSPMSSKWKNAGPQHAVNALVWAQSDFTN